MDAAVWGVLGVVVGSIIAGFFANRGERIKAEREAELDQHKRADDRRLAANAFQRENLLQLQEALTEWMRKLAEMMIADEQAFRETGKRAAQFGEDVSQGEMMAARRLRYLTERVRDDALRERLGELRALSWRATTARTVEDLHEAHDRLTHEGVAASEHVGRVLRSYL